MEITRPLLVDKLQVRTNWNRIELNRWNDEMKVTSHEWRREGGHGRFRTTKEYFIWWLYEFQETPLSPLNLPARGSCTKVGYGSRRFLVKPPTCILAHLLLSGPLVPTRSTEWARLYTSPVWRVSSNRDFDTDLQVFPDVAAIDKWRYLMIVIAFAVNFAYVELAE